MATLSKKWWVICDDCVTGPHKGRPAAERRRQRIEASGGCRLEHRVEQHDREPLPAAEQAESDEDTTAGE